MCTRAVVANDISPVLTVATRRFTAFTNFWTFDTVGITCRHLHIRDCHDTVDDSMLTTTLMCICGPKYLSHFSRRASDNGMMPLPLLLPNVCKLQLRSMLWFWYQTWPYTIREDQSAAYKIPFKNRALNLEMCSNSTSLLNCLWKTRDNSQGEPRSMQGVHPEVHLRVTEEYSYSTPHRRDMCR